MAFSVNWQRKLMKMNWKLGALWFTTANTFREQISTFPFKCALWMTLICTLKGFFMKSKIGKSEFCRIYCIYTWKFYERIITRIFSSPFNIFLVKIWKLIKFFITLAFFIIILCYLLLKVLTLAFHNHQEASV